MIHWLFQRLLAHTNADIILFCGVHFMAETASILCPDKKVLIPDLSAGCSLASSINVDELKAWKREHPDAMVVSLRQHFSGGKGVIRLLLYLFKCD